MVEPETGRETVTKLNIATPRRKINCCACGYSGFSWTALQNWLVPPVYFEGAKKALDICPVCGSFQWVIEENVNGGEK